MGVRGLRNRYRWPGIGAPLIASIEPLAGVDNPAYSLIHPGVKVPVTIFVRLDEVDKGIKSGTIRDILISTRPMNHDRYHQRQSGTPGVERSSALAYTLEGSQVYSFELKGLLSVIFHFPSKKFPASEMIYF